VERSADWLDQARGDLAHARNDLEDGFYDWTCFSCQQAAEKAVKAVFQKIGAEAWGHSVAELLQVLQRVQSVEEDIIDLATELDRAYIPARYPNAHPASSPRRLYVRAEAERMVEHADRILRFCEGLLSTL
jgi:HEPN domain-containing protein